MKTPIYFKWPNKVWIISDPHFGDLGILKFERTQFKSIDEHDNYIIKMINRYVQPGDTIVFLGDMGHNWEEPIKNLKKDLYKVLLMGNHDNTNRNKYTSIFDEVYPDGPLFVNKFIVLSHEPIPVSDHFINVHGHLHNSFLDDDHHLNASAHVCNYIPMDLDKVYRLTSNYPRINAKFLKEWYADKYVFINKDRADVYMFKDTGHIIPKETLKFVEDIFVTTDTEEIDERKYKFFHSKVAKSIEFKSNETWLDIARKLEEKYASMEGTDESLWNN